MDLYIQMGHGMQKMCLDLFEHWKNGTVILSPMNIQPESIVQFSSKVNKLSGDVLFDPQLYYPRKYHKNLSKYDYWPKENFTLLETGSFDKVIEQLIKINDSIGASKLILPSFIAGKIDEKWDDLQKKIIESANNKNSKFENIHTIALSSDVVTNEIQIEKIINFVEKWNVAGVYIVCEHPSKNYLVDDTLWVSNLLALVAGIKRLNKFVIVGYCSHQQLCLATAKCDAIAAGNFLNVRWFQPGHFETIENDSKSRRAKWYYCPHALTEFKITFLDIAQRMDLLNTMEIGGKMKNEYSEMLFNGAIPSSTGYGESESFKHYLWCLKEQCKTAVRSSYKETFDAQILMLDTAEQVLSTLHDKRIKGQERDFMDVLNINQVALTAHNMAHQFALSQEWDKL